MKKKICLISADPNFLGGVSLYTKNLIEILKKTNPLLKITWIYKGKRNRKFNKEGINYIEIKTPKIILLEELLFNQKIKRYLDKNYFDVINSHALWGYWMKSYKKKKGQKIIHTYHGTTYYFYENHLRRFNFIKRTFASFLLLYGFIIEKPPIKKADKIICVSEHVKKELKELYSSRNNLFVIRTGVDLNQFKKRSKKALYSKLGLDKDKFYGLYVGRGGFWTKGLDRVIKISKEIHNLNNSYQLLIAGPDKSKVEHLIKEDFTIFIPLLKREEIPFYYNISNITFCLSRYEGGAPTLTAGEAMASGSLIICSKDSRQEIIGNEEEGIVLEEFEGKDAKKILDVLKDKKKLKKISENAQHKIKEFSLERWGKEYWRILFDEKNK